LNQELWLRGSYIENLIPPSSKWVSESGTMNEDKEAYCRSIEENFGRKEANVIDCKAIED